MREAPMIDPSTGALSFNLGQVRFGPETTPESLKDIPSTEAPGPSLVRAMTSRLIAGLRSQPGEDFSVCLDFLGPTLTSARLMAKGGDFPPDLSDWSLEREMARHDFHCLWIRRQLGWLWRLRRPAWGRVTALCGRNLDKTPRLSVIKVVYVEFDDIQSEMEREFGGR